MEARGFVASARSASASPGPAAWLLAGVVFLGLTAFVFGPVLACLDRCYVDVDAIHPFLGTFEFNDMRLNTWILAWVQRALLGDPSALFQPNAFHPAPDMLTGSEHLIGLALLTLPLRLLTDNAVLVYQATMVLSFWLIAMTTFALVRWLTGAMWIALLAGAFALLMPWRMAEFAHIQLLGAHWIPLVWLLGLRILLGPERRSDPVWLAVVLALQLLTSFYLAYQIVMTLALLVLATAAMGRLRVRALLRFGAATGVALVPFTLAALPYLARQGSGQLPSQGPSVWGFGADNVARVAGFLAPRLPGFREATFAYWLPLSLLLFAVLAAVLSLVRRDGPGSLAPRVRVTVVFLWACVLSSAVMMLGASITLGDTTLTLPYGWAAWIVPGFENLRAPARFGVTIGIALPVLAAAALPNAIQLAAGTRATRRRALQLAVAALLLVDLPWRSSLPAAPVAKDPEQSDDLYAALRDLPPGPVLELPWPPYTLASIGLDTRYMLASTRHWKPILNGFTAYLPPSLFFLRRLAWRLPDADALGNLVRFTDLRWVIVRLPMSARREWKDAETGGLLRRVYSNAGTRIFEVTHREDGGVWEEALLSPDPERTLSGVSRRRLDLPAGAGSIEVLAPPRLRYLRSGAPKSPVRLRVANRSDLDWAGFDPLREGIVGLRAVFSDRQDQVVVTRTAPLDVDVPARASVDAVPLVRPPDQKGRYRLCLDLVQFLADDLRPLPVPPVEIEVRVPWIDPELEGTVRGPADRARIEPDPSVRAPSRCAVLRTLGALGAGPTQ